MSGTPSPAPALAPVRASMLQAAADQADGIRAGARREAAVIVARARESATAAIAQAQAEGQRDAAAFAAAERGRGRSEARSVLLSAQRAALDALHARVSDEIKALRGDPGYAQLHDRITRMARLAAGPDAVLTGSPDGGVLARSPGVVVDCSLARFADLAIQALGPGVRELWTP